MGFSQFHPMIVFFYYMGAGILMMSTNQALFLSGSLLSLLVTELLKNRLAVLKKWISGYLLFFVLVWLMTILPSHEGTHMRSKGLSMEKRKVIERCRLLFSVMERFCRFLWKRRCKLRIRSCHAAMARAQGLLAGAGS